MFILTGVLLAMLFAGSNKAVAQGVSVNINLGHQPAWGPIGYDYARFYYFPDMNVYYDVNGSMFYYPSGSRWVSSQYLPARYRRYDPYRTYKVVINDDRPWLNNGQHRKMYSRYKNNHSQVSIRDSRDAKYQQNRNKIAPWVKENPKRNKQPRRMENRNRPTYRY